MFKQLLAVVLAFVAAAAFAAVDVNKASQADLEGVKGIGPAIATKILDERKKSNFKDWGDLVTRVNGIGEGNAAKFSEAGLTVGGSAFKGASPAAAPAKKEEKAAAAPAATKKEEKAAAAPAAAKKDDKPAAAAPAKADDKAAAKEAAAKAKADEKAKAKAEKEAAAKAKADDKAKAKADKEAAKAKKDDKPSAKADKEAKPAAAAASGAKK